MPSPDYDTSTRFGLRLAKGDTLVSDIDQAFHDLGNDVDTKMVGILQGTLAARPAAGYANRLYYETDTGALDYDTGTAWLTIVGGQVAPIGTLADHVGSTDPSANWLVCDGRSLLRTAYPTLFSVMGGAIFGSADGTHFYLPDLRGRVTVGAGAGPGLTTRTIAATGGEESHALSTGEMPSHAHGVTDPGHAHTTTMYYKGAGAAGSINNAGGGTYPLDQNGGTATAGTGVSIQSSGGGGGHNTMQPFLALNKIIRVL